MGPRPLNRQDRHHQPQAQQRKRGGIVGVGGENVLADPARLAQTLRRRGFLSTPAGRKDYILGSSLWTLSRQYDWSNMLVRVAHDELKSLAHGLNETAHLAIREGKKALFIDFVHARHVLVVAGQSGELVPLYATAHGKALLADADEQSLRSILGSGPLEKFTKTTIKTIPALATRRSTWRTCAASRLRSG